MNNQNFDHFNVILTGKLLEDFGRGDAIKKAANLFHTSVNKVDGLLNGKQQVFKRDIPHKDAYKYQQALMSCGIEAKLTHITVTETETCFTLVPEGEEQTSYSQLLEKIEHGEMIECDQCHTLQVSSVFCTHCGHQLKEQEAPPRKSMFSSKKLIIIIGVLIVLVTVVIFALPNSS
ncbi:hypothetical protein [Aliikangiella sp. IMCC44359]|uniref:hypothetical protein n=1 Tax=Aliikangiella sp. IMCC44359 TaxID=3459125 RepID=UPI00403AF2E4